MDPLQHTRPPGSEKTSMALQKPGPRSLKGKVVRGPGAAGGEAAQLRKAAQEFESVFMSEVLKGMRGSIHKEDMFHGGPGEDLFEGMLDDEVSKRIAGQGRLGIGEMLYRDLSLRFHVGKEEGQKASADTEVKRFIPLHPGPSANGSKTEAPVASGGLPLKPQAGAAPAQPSPLDAAGVEAQVRKLRQQGMGITGATLRK